MPELKGSVTPSAAAVAIAASTALPPFLSTRRPTLVAARSTVLTAPPMPVLVGVLAAAGAAGGARSAPWAGTASAGAATRAATASGAIRRACMDVLPSSEKSLHPTPDELECRPPERVAL